MSNAYISIDLGTTRLKVTAFDTLGGFLHQVDKRHKEHHVGAYRWQDANEWWSDTQASIAEVLRAIEPRNVSGISLSGRGNAGVFLDSDGNVIGQPWSDDRHRPYVDALTAWRTNRHLSNYGLGLIAKLQWIQNNLPKAEIRYACFGKDFLLYRLTGMHITDWSSGPDADAWDPHVDEEMGIGELLPAVRLPWELAGGLRADVARSLGIAAGTPVAVGAHDGICANVGAGATRASDYAITLGTHAVTRAITNAVPHGAYRFYGLPPDRHVIGGNALMGGRSADWFCDLIEAPNSDRQATFRALENAASSKEMGADGIRFMPFLSGQVSPQRRPRASGVFSGLHTHHERGDLYRSVLEGVAFAIKEIFDQITGWCGQPTKTRLTGGGSKSRLWVDILSHTLNQPLEISDAAVEGRGAAIFLAVALGAHSSYDEAADKMIPITRRVEPDASAVQAYQDIYTDWQRVMEATRNLDN